MTISENFAQLLEENLEEIDVKPGQIVTGAVLDITPNHVVVNAGFKSESIIPIEQFYDEKGELEVAVGDEVDVALDAIEDGFGETLLSRDKAKKMAEWTKLEKIYAAGETISGQVAGRVKGGFTIEVGALKGFLPGSLVDVRPVRDTSYLEGKNIEMKIIKMDQKRNNVVVSRRAVLEAESQEERSALLEKLEEGQAIKGIVKNLTDYGAFVDLGGIDGLLHITDMSWRRIKHPSEVVNVGDELEVRILKFDRERNRVSLGLKQMRDDPWTDITTRYPINSRHTGIVSNITDYGCFIELEGGVEGLAHVSEMDWTNKNVNPHKVVHLGDKIEVMVLEIDQERRRISLGIKQCQENPWHKFAETYQKGEHIKGTIKSITDFGIFIGLDGGIDGLVHLSDVSWNKSSEEAVHNYTKGQEIETIILAIDPERERISLGIKQLEETPFTKFIQKHEKGSAITGTVTGVDEKRAVLALGGEVVGHMRASEVARGKVEDIHDHLKVGDEVETLITGFDNKNCIVNLSVKALQSKADTKVKTKAKTGIPKPETSTTPTLGDIFKAQLEGKDSTEDEEKNNGAANNNSNNNNNNSG